jgi:uncharacterized protein
VPHWTPSLILAAIVVLLPLFAAAFLGERIAGNFSLLPTASRLLPPVVLSLPYILVTFSFHNFRWGWFALYAALPTGVAAILWRAAGIDPTGRSTWYDYTVLCFLGLAVDLRWFEPAWPAHLAIFNKMILLDAGIYGFLLIRRLEGVGFSLRLRRQDLTDGLRELAFYTPLAVPLGLTLGFLHLHRQWPTLGRAALAWAFTFLFIAIPEELFFRGWLQNLLERRLGRNRALFLTAILFGLSHFNKRAAHFNWRYVLLAALAGIFYGRAWRAHHRVAASAITHSSVDTLWSLFLR